MAGQPMVAPRVWPVPTTRLLQAAGLLLGIAAAIPVVPWLRTPWLALLIVLAVLVATDYLIRPAPAAVALTRTTARSDLVGRHGSYQLQASHRGSGALDIELREVLPAAL